MKKIFFTLFSIGSLFSVTAQTTQPATTNNNWKQKALEAPGDHFMISLTSDHWSGAPDSISSRTKGTSRGIGVALMINKPFRTDPHWSVAFGLGISNSNIFFNKTSVDLAAPGNILPFRNLDSTDNFKKYKLATTFLEVPVELRYSLHPDRNKTWKFAIGAKVGTLLNAHTKGKTWRDKNGNTLNSYTEKVSKKAFFNGTRFVGTARVGIGNFSLVGTYQLTSLFKDGTAADIKPFQIGICISGL
ncbi:MAG: porin family protein [Ferruginibacter sp.]